MNDHVSVNPCFHLILSTRSNGEYGTLSQVIFMGLSLFDFFFSIPNPNPKPSKKILIASTLLLFSSFTTLKNKNHTRAVHRQDKSIKHARANRTNSFIPTWVPLTPLNKINFPLAINRALHAPPMNVIHIINLNLNPPSLPHTPEFT